MDTALLTAVAALAGSLIGAGASVLTTMLTQRAQYSSQQRVSTLARRETLYSDFIMEASRRYAEALDAEKPVVSELVTLMALTNRIRLHADPETVDASEKVFERLIEAYFAPPIKLEELRDPANRNPVNPLLEFSEAARIELRRIG